MEGCQNSKFSFQFQNVVISTSATTSGAPDHLIRSVSSSEYGVTICQIISWSKMFRILFFTEFWSKIPHFYPLGGVIGASATTWSHAGAAAVRGDPPASLSTHGCMPVGAKRGCGRGPNPWTPKGKSKREPSSESFRE